VAKDRLQLVLMHDRSDLTAEQVKRMKDEILEVIARYVEFDPTKVEIDLSSHNRETLLRAEIPIEPISRRRRPRGGVELAEATE
jgi:cell division topological specificity factor